jgi:erythritol transport system ATP-binding protein
VLEIARAVTHRSKILILDEPTSALSQAESEALFATIGELLKAGLTIIYISHRLEELMRLGDYFTVLRSGQVVGESMRGEVTRDWIVSTMSGRAAQDRAVSKRQSNDTVVLDVQDLSLAPGAEDGSAQTALHGISFQVCQGEILGIYGLLGAGRTELLEVLAGLRAASTGCVKLRGSLVQLGSVAQALEAGIVLVPEDRQRDGLIPELSVRENVVLAMAGEHWVSRARETAIVRELVRKLRMDVRDLELPVTALSGGNQQKVLLARCLVRSPQVLLLDEPTRGVDANAKVEIYHLLRELASEGLSIVFTSSEIEETEELADRALVLCQGRISAEFAGDTMTDSALMNAASPRTQLEQENVFGVATI